MSDVDTIRERLDLAALRSWAEHRDPDHPERKHAFDARCPWCRSDDVPQHGLYGAHETALALLDVLVQVEAERDALRAFADELATWLTNARTAIAGDNAALDAQVFDMAKAVLGRYHDFRKAPRAADSGTPPAKEEA